MNPTCDVSACGAPAAYLVTFGQQATTYPYCAHHATRRERDRSGRWHSAPRWQQGVATFIPINDQGEP